MVYLRIMLAGNFAGKVTGWTNVAIIVNRVRRYGRPLFLRVRVEQPGDLDGTEVQR